MKFKNRDHWLQSAAINKNSDYGMAIHAIAETWANLMEEQMPKSIHDTAEETYHKACSIVDSRLTEQSLPPVVSLLAGSWEYGEELLSWYTQTSWHKEYIRNGRIKPKQNEREL